MLLVGAFSTRLLLRKNYSLGVCQLVAQIILKVLIGVGWVNSKLTCRGPTCSSLVEMLRGELARIV
jgi:hypothetical protein